MSRLLHTAAIAAMALALPLVLSAQTNLNLDAGSTGSSGGDIVFNGTSIAPVNAAELSNSTSAVSAEFSTFTETILAGFPYSSTPIGSSSLVVNEFFAVQTNGGNYAKVLLTAVSSTSITLQYVTYSSSSGAAIQQGSSINLSSQSSPGAPTIAAVLNNYSSTLPNAPNYGIAPGTLVVIYGTNLADTGSTAVLQDSTKGLPQTLNGSSVSITVNGTTVNPAFYYAIPGQIAVVIPSTTPVGTGTITVTHGGLPSAATPIKIVASAFGFDIWDGAVAAVTDSNYALLTTTHSAIPNQTYVFWGSGLGASTADSDTTYTATPHPISVPGGLQIFVGGIPATTIYYAGRNGFPGLDQINVTIPANAPTGCAVSVVAMSGTGSTAVVSNLANISISPNGGTCTDAFTFVDPTLAAALAGKATVSFGSVSIDQATDSAGTITDNAAAGFYSISGVQLTGYQSSSEPSLGSCYVTQSSSSVATSPFTLTGLDAGSISVQGPNGTQALSEIAQFPGIYGVQLPLGFVPASGGAFTFNGTGGAGAGAFTAGLSFPNPMTWINASSDGTINRANGVTVTWTGGAAGTYVHITGSASTGSGFSAYFICNAPASAGTFTVPPGVLLALPAGSGGLEVSDYTNPQPFTATPLDFAFAEAFTSTSINATYN